MPRYNIDDRLLKFKVGDRMIDASCVIRVEAARFIGEYGVEKPRRECRLRPMTCRSRADLIKHAYAVSQCIGRKAVPDDQMSRLKDRYDRVYNELSNMDIGNKKGRKRLIGKMKVIERLLIESGNVATEWGLIPVGRGSFLARVAPCEKSKFFIGPRSSGLIYRQKKSSRSCSEGGRK